MRTLPFASPLPRASFLASAPWIAAAFALLTGCGGGGGGSSEPAAAGTASGLTLASSGTCSIANFSQQALALVNEFRSQPRSCGVDGNFAAAPALTWNDKLAQAALGHSTDMATLNFFSHTSQDGRTLSDRVNATGYLWTGVGENIAAGQPTLAAVMTAWEGSDGHCANLMNPAFQEVGLACVPGTSTSTYNPYWTMDFGRPR